MRAIEWTLRLTVALQCIGNAGWFLQIQETPLLALMWGSPDLGGWGLTEAAALFVQQVLGWGVVALAICVLCRPSAWVLVPQIALQFAIAAAIIRTHSGFLLDWHWLPRPLADLFPFAAHSTRIATPLALLMVGLPTTGSSLAPRTRRGMALLRYAVALTFVAHGIEALHRYAPFVDFILLAARRLWEWNLEQATAEGMLVIIGVVDICVAFLLVTTRWRWIACYMVFWGFVTALSRVIAQDWEFGWHALLTRTPHFGAPLAIAVYWSFSPGAEEASNAIETRT